MTSPLVELLIRELRISEREVLHLIATAPERYKVYTIPKRNGGRREIAHPAKELKVAQRAVVNSYLNNLPIHDAAMAYKIGRSIKDNAAYHAGSGSILKYDFVEFFPSITEFAWIAYCDRHAVMDRADAIRSGRILFRRPKGGRILRLSIGAPSSPILSNILMHDFDEEVTQLVAEHKIKYTRYADDLTFSAERTGYLTAVDKILRGVIARSKAPKLKINDSKTVLATPKVHRQVTGLILTLDGKVSIGKNKKREIRVKLDYFRKGLLGEREVAPLAGYMSYIWDVERDFYIKMQRHYGEEVLARLQKQGQHKISP
ncbi:retron St85 family RNA-directed DNA polymerase [Novosphingobium sp. 1949]|uniref:RNA-directed DNA polymerase n=1 Tax=Novosphingobium organovorum TaxID=2930092 RepID=A0ABT0BII4_9SPHN|nr:retron St85 family RNA-directed DNA polymerase [Novosphingobium organovorum]MCJ2184544.1 retron St85 family RNA-directed DNA polymerase [Novosphingobium organovorum]